jgi:hypothetical protein
MGKMDELNCITEDWKSDKVDSPEGENKETTNIKT